MAACLLPSKHSSGTHVHYGQLLQLLWHVYEAQPMLVDGRSHGAVYLDVSGCHMLRCSSPGADTVHGPTPCCQVPAWGWDQVSKACGSWPPLWWPCLGTPFGTGPTSAHILISAFLDIATLFGLSSTSSSRRHSSINKAGRGASCCRVLLSLLWSVVPHSTVPGRPSDQGRVQGMSLLIGFDTQDPLPLP